MCVWRPDRALHARCGPACTSRRTAAEGRGRGTNDFGQEGYGGPRPPQGDPAHRDFFRVFALSEPRGLDAGFSGDDLRSALKGTEIDSGVLVGLFQR